MTITRSFPDGLFGEGTAVFSDDMQHRYVLTRTWDTERPYTCFVMLNPSKATEEVLDPTVARCLGFARAWGSGGLIVLNAFALRSTEPKALYGSSDPIGSLNDCFIKQTVQHLRPTRIVAAWGEHAARLDRNGRRRPRDEPDRRLWKSRGHEVAELLGDGLLALRVSKGGNPGHPLYIPASALPLPWRPTSD